MCGGSAEAEDAKRIVHPLTAAIFIQSAIGSHAKIVHTFVNVVLVRLCKHHQQCTIMHEQNLWSGMYPSKRKKRPGSPWLQTFTLSYGSRITSAYITP